MTIKIKSGKLRLVFWVPLSILKSRLGYKICTSAMAGNSRRADENCCEHPQEETCCEQQQGQDYTAAQEETVCRQQSDAQNGAYTTRATESNDERNDKKPNIAITHQQLKELYKVLRQYIKRDGHFNLVEVNSPSSNAYVRIRV